MTKMSRMTNLKHSLHSYFKTPIRDNFSLLKRILSVFLEISIGKRLFPLCLTFLSSLFGTFLPRFSDLAFPPSQYELSRRLSPYLTKKEN